MSAHLSNVREKPFPFIFLLLLFFFFFFYWTKFLMMVTLGVTECMKRLRERELLDASQDCLDKTTASQLDVFWVGGVIGTHQCLSFLHVHNTSCMCKRSDSNRRLSMRVKSSHCPT